MAQQPRYEVVRLDRNGRHVEAVREEVADALAEAARQLGKFRPEEEGTVEIRKRVINVVALAGAVIGESGASA